MVIELDSSRARIWTQQSWDSWICTGSHCTILLLHHQVSLMKWLAKTRARTEPYTMSLVASLSADSSLFITTSCSSCYKSAFRLCFLSLVPGDAKDSLNWLQNLKSLRQREEKGGSLALEHCWPCVQAFLFLLLAGDRAKVVQPLWTAAFVPSVKWE